MFCKKCGCEISSDSKFCYNCGNKIINDDKNILVQDNTSETYGKDFMKIVIQEDYIHAFKLCELSIKEIKNCKIITSSIDSGKIKAETKKSFTSFGEEIYINIFKISEDSVEISIHSKLVYGLVAAGKSKDNVYKIAKYILENTRQNYDYYTELQRIKSKKIRSFTAYWVIMVALSFGVGLSAYNNYITRFTKNNRVASTSNNKVTKNEVSSKNVTKNQSDLNQINSIGNVFLESFLKNNYNNATKDARIEVRVFKNINFEKLFSECSNVVMSSFNLEAKSTGISSNVQYGIDNIKLIDSNNAILTFVIRSNISGEQIAFNGSAVKIDGQWKIDMESFLVGISKLLNG